MAEDKQQDVPLHELLTRDMVDIYVSADNVKYTLHSKLLSSRSAFFARMLSGKTSSISLTDEDPEPFSQFVGWLYSGRLPPVRSETDLTHLLDLSLMAEKWEIGTLVTATLAGVRDWYRENESYPALRRVQYVYANTEAESAMRGLLVGAVARMLVLGEGMPAQWDKALRKNGQLAVDILLAVQRWGLEAERVPDVRVESVRPIVEVARERKAEEEEKRKEMKKQGGEQNGEKELQNGVQEQNGEDEEMSE